MLWEQSIQHAELTDVGYRRQNNQDSYAVQLAGDVAAWQEHGHFFIVADGMGGHAVGELASKMAVDEIPHLFAKLTNQKPLKESMRLAIEEANQKIHRRGKEHREFDRMGTTGTCLCLGPFGAVIGHVGDSRVYRIRHSRIDQLTRDHSLIWELIEQRKVHPRDAEKVLPRNVITRSIGPDATVEVDVEGPLDVQPGDVYVLCSDGLSSLVTDSEIGMVAAELPPADACRMLVNLANLRGGLDNVTTLVIRIGAALRPTSSGAGEVESESTLAGGDPSVASVLGGLIFFLCAGLAAIGVLTMMFSESKLAGGVLLGLAAAGTLGWAVWAARNRPAATGGEMSVNSDSTIIWKPYRTASARVTPDFLEKLARMEAELQTIASEEAWDIDWTAYNEADRKARVSLAKKRFSRSIEEFARAIQVLIAGVNAQRKKMLNAKRGVTEVNPEAPLE